MDDLNHRLAPFSGERWRRVDAAAHAAAREVLLAWRFLDADGPYGIGLASLAVGPEDDCRQPAADEAQAVCVPGCK